MNGRLMIWNLDHRGPPILGVGFGIHELLEFFESDHARANAEYGSKWLTSDSRFSKATRPTRGTRVPVHVHAFTIGAYTRKACSITCVTSACLETDRLHAYHKDSQESAPRLCLFHDALDL